MRKTVWLLGAAGMFIAMGSAFAADGKAVYEKDCAGCHSAMSPKMGDKAAWAPRIRKGAAALAAAVVKGNGKMPAMGGADSEAEVKAAVAYIISQSK